jgi:hypothetical protein
MQAESSIELLAAEQEHAYEGEDTQPDGDTEENL